MGTPTPKGAGVEAGSQGWLGCPKSSYRCLKRHHGCFGSGHGCPDGVELVLRLH